MGSRRNQSVGGGMLTNMFSLVSTSAGSMFASTLTFAGGSIVDQLATMCMLWQSTFMLGAASLPSIWMGYLVVGLQVAAGLGFVIFVHELGHFLAAKTFGVKCEKFYVGFDVPISIGPIKLPRTLGRFRWGETEYGIGIVPLGGYVKMLGQDDDPRNAEEEAKRSRQGNEADAPLDPRSYQAKPVWQRMIIISAGVVMNVIFAVFLAAAAFLYGVPYSPTIIGGTQMGSPSWQVGLQPGDYVLQMAKMSKDDPYLRFEDMGGKTVVHGLRFGDAPLPFTIDRDGSRMTITATPTKKLHPDGFYLVGMTSSSIAVLADKPSTFSYLGREKVDLRKGDRIIEIDGESLPVGPHTDEILAYQVTDRLQGKWNKPVEFTVVTASDDKSGKQAEAEARKVVVPPVPTKTLGIGFAIGPVTAIRKGSAAEIAGVKVGDIIDEIDGQPVTDAMKLPMIVAEKQGKAIEFKLRRPKNGAAAAEGDSNKGKADDKNAAAQNAAAQNAADKSEEYEEVTLAMQSEERPRFATIGAVSGQNGLENYGIAYAVLATVASVDSESEKAARSVEVGDLITQFKFEPTDEELKELAENEMAISDSPVQIGQLRTTASLMSLCQSLPVGMKVRCYFKRENDVREVVLPVVETKDWYWATRGIPMRPLEKIQQTASATQALQWGVGETGRRLGDVGEFLMILVTGRASPKALAGPFGIAEAAAHEASSSPSRLLLFLTLLSANLAILNFLPIPALDGGHLAFLLWEAVAGKPVNEAVQVRLTMVGVMCLLGLMAFAILNDILRKIL